VKTSGLREKRTEKKYARKHGSAIPSHRVWDLLFRSVSSGLREWQQAGQVIDIAGLMRNSTDRSA